MKSQKQAILEDNGWKIGDATDFLGLSAAETTLLEMRDALGLRVRTLRTEAAITQSELASRTSQRLPATFQSLRRVDSLRGGSPPLLLRF